MPETITDAILDTLRTAHDAQVLALAIVNTIPDPFLVLDEELHVLAASRAFYEVFRVDVAETKGRSLFALGDGQWNIPALRPLLETIIPDRVAMDGFEVEHDFPGLGPRIMLLNARKVIYEDSPAITILLAFRDVTDIRAIEAEKAALLARAEQLLGQKQMLLEEMRHRVANSLQIIASILLLKARAVASDETRAHLKDAHLRVMSVATVQHHLHTVDGIAEIEVAPYLNKLCAGLTASMIGEASPIAMDVVADAGMAESATAVSLGLIVTELVINAIKYAFPGGKADARILVRYERNQADWKLTISDNGVGQDGTAATSGGSGLGTTIIEALAKQLAAVVEISSGPGGLSTSVTRASFTSRPMPVETAAI
ncbi:MAG: histidine kinase [Sphingomonas bacterium]|uniref:sensor histidine kinase n=1 Tax=Sphingomonas bacterium TaxID=1895847 RepID=UPI00261BDCF1|nr:histidine kinase dimerization/phosphoacceptor domain -containing protein [Sphingomonas bacterium]MDB5709434.1 histidine kinase [Sphingomonas bacterium]